MRVIYHRFAEEELVNAAKYYEQALPGLGSRFLDLVDESIKRIEQNYEWSELVAEDVRRISVSQFPYSMFFRVASGNLRILAVKHHSRGTDYWKGRK